MYGKPDVYDKPNVYGKPDVYGKKVVEPASEDATVAAHDHEQHPPAADEPRRPAGADPADAPGGHPDDDLGRLSTEEIIAELQRRQGHIREAHARRTRLLQQLAEVEMEILRLGGSIPGRNTQPVGGTPPPPAGGGAPAPAGDLSGLTLPRAIAQVVRIGEVFSPKEAATRLREAGYRSRAKAFSTAVTQALGRDNHFRRVGHGQYERVG